MKHIFYTHSNITNLVIFETVLSLVHKKEDVVILTARNIKWLYSNKYISTIDISNYQKLDYDRINIHHKRKLRELIESIIDKYEAETDTDKKKELFNEIIANTPSGLMLTARMTTNYLQLKSIINQRSNHKMQEWKYLCDWFKTLPMFKELVCKE